MVAVPSLSMTCLPPAPLVGTLTAQDKGEAWGALSALRPELGAREGLSQCLWAAEGPPQEGAVVWGMAAVQCVQAGVSLLSSWASPRHAREVSSP